MGGLLNANVIVVGAGVFGLACALQLRRAGAKVTLIYPSSQTQSASAVAAGMLAPAFESVLDPAAKGWFAYLAGCRDLWPEFTDDLATVGLTKCGALMRGTEQEVARTAKAMTGEGAAFEAEGGDLFTPEDWRLEPHLALKAMRDRFLALGGERLHGEVTVARAGRAVLKSGEAIEADAVVVACGFAGRKLVPELSALHPIKGQLVRFPASSPIDGPVLRFGNRYLAPGAEGPVYGATMQPDIDDPAVDPAVTAMLKAEVIQIEPLLAGRPCRAYAGIRPATPDGLPMIGQAANGVWVATGARRNGWLLAPMAAMQIADGVGGKPTLAEYDPVRFQS
jgi:glycine oxidase